MAVIFIIARAQVDKRPVETLYKGGKYLTFRVGRQDFAISAVQVRGILPVHQMEVVEGAGNSILGFAHLDGHDFPMIDLQAKLGIAPGPRGREPFIVVVETAAGLAGFIADRISEVLDLRPRHFRSGAVRAHGRPRKVLEPDQIMSEEDRPSWNRTD
jgi:chemotaxis signal transduction protein